MLVSLTNALVESSRVCSERPVEGPVNSSPAMPLCATCSLSERCLPGERAIADAVNTDKHLFGRRRIRASERLYSQGELFECLFEVRSGNLKSSLPLADGQERVSALHMAGELIGLSSGKRVAAFLLSLSQRMSARGYSPNEFHLRMPRADIASYLGLTHETVCCSFSAFRRSGLLEVDQRHIRIVDRPGLRLVSSGQIPK